MNHIKYLKSLATLKKISKSRMEDIAQELSRAQHQQDSLQQKFLSLDKELIDIETKSFDYEARRSFSSYWYGVEDKKKILKEDIDRIQIDIDALRENLREHYADLKKYEAMMDKQEEIQNAESEKKEMQEIEQAFLRKR